MSSSFMIPRNIYLAVDSGEIEPVRFWLYSSHRERDLNEVIEFEGVDESGSLLHASVFPTGRRDRTRLLELLLDHGADASAVTLNFRVTALHWCKHPGEAALLLDRGADIEAQTARGSRPIFFAVSAFPVLHFLVRRGANVFAKHDDGRDAEAEARANLAHTSEVGATQLSSKYQKSADFLAEVKRAGGWKQYWRAPRIELVRLRSLCDRGRAAPPSTASSAKLGTLQALTLAETIIFERLFGPSATRSPRGPSNRLPNEIFWKILTFWRSSRDSP